MSTPDTAGVTSELQGSWNREDALRWTEVYTKTSRRISG
ncbi:Uncharacterised protein [Serratia grimesii]|jgi:hypothetical protein|nr:Uncharacterised protein [Serratia grimesii]